VLATERTALSLSHAIYTVVRREVWKNVQIRHLNIKIFEENEWLMSIAPLTVKH